VADHPTPGWDFWVSGGGATPEPTPAGGCRTTVLGAADGLQIALVEAEPGYVWDPHVHGFPEFLLVLHGTVRTQGRILGPGDGYAAATGSSHPEFETGAGATYVLISRG
jgi:hypothetical protein